MVNVQTIQPSFSELAAYVDCYWQYTFAGDLESDKLFLPEGIFEIIFDLGDPVHVKSKEADTWTQRPSCFVGGLFDHRYQLTLRGRLQLFGVRFKVGAFRHFVPFPLQEVRNQMVALEAIYGREAITLTDEIRGLSTLTERERLVSRFLLAQCTIHRKPPSFAQELVARATFTHQQCRLEAQRLGVTDRHLRRVFNRDIGLSPKRFFQIKRMQAFLKSTHSKAPLTDRAFEFGYFDQPHFINDCKKLVGTPPSLAYDQLHTFQRFFFT